MNADPRGVVLALRRAVKEGNDGMADFLTDEIVAHLEALDAVQDPEVLCRACMERVGVAVDAARAAYGNGSGAIVEPKVGRDA